MSDCTNWGSPGTSVPLPDLVATGTTALAACASGYTQTGNTVTVTIYSGGSTPTQVASISGGGNNGTITPMSSATFSLQPSTTYYAVVSSTQGQTPQVLYSYDGLAYGTTTYAGTCILCVEDTPSGGDCDFNDALVTISWTLFAG
jgi:hypothetical protein